MILPTNDQNLRNREGLLASFRNAWALNLYGVPLLLLCTVFDVFLVLQIFFQFENAGTPRSALNFAHCPSLFQRLRWVSL